jgi:sugar/nucleoside kinase (ribokinase family)
LVDLIAPGGMGTFDVIAPGMPYTDYLLPNEEQVLGFTAFAVDTVDTTGCGDVFSASFVYATRIGRSPRRFCRRGVRGVPLIVRNLSD